MLDLFVFFLSFYFSPLFCLSLFDLRILITPLVSPISSSTCETVFTSGTRRITTSFHWLEVWANKTILTPRWEGMLHFVASGLYIVFCLFTFPIVLSVLVRFTDSDYPFGIVNIFFHMWDYFQQLTLWHHEREWIHVFWKSKNIVLHWWHPSYYHIFSLTGGLGQ
jgi:hypothetical protein